MAGLTQVEYGGWATNHQLSNGLIDVIITGEVGPRLIHFGFTGEGNEFYNDPATLGYTGDEWQLYGGHRFWHAPEHPTRTYLPENKPVTVKERDGKVIVRQPVERETGLRKVIELTMPDGKAHMRVVHRLRNTGLWPVTCAPWALSVMAGGVGIVPLPPRGTHPEALLPSNTLTLWPYTHMNDPRWTWGEKYILLRFDSHTNAPQKVGADVKDNWIASVRDGHLFVKLFRRVDGATYPDLGCTIEMFTNHFMLEVETLGPLQTIQPQTGTQHTEDWFLFRDVPTPTHDADVDANILPRVREAQQYLEAWR
jgi:hypothetical protein